MNLSPWYVDFRPNAQKFLPKKSKKFGNFDVLGACFWQGRFNHVIQVTTGVSEKRWDVPIALTKGSNVCRQKPRVKKAFARVPLD
jgi:hypothetical protein